MSNHAKPYRELRHVAVFGVPGSGKDFLLDRVAESRKPAHNLRVIQVGKRIAQYLNGLESYNRSDLPPELRDTVPNGISSRDQIRNMADLMDVSEGLEFVLHDAIRAARSEETLVFNAQIVHWHHEPGWSYPRYQSLSGSHATGYATGAGGLVNESGAYQRLRPSPHTYLHIISDPEQILAWRALDVDRQRRAETAETVAEHQEMSLAAAEHTAQLTGAEFITIHNTPERITETLAIMGSAILNASQHAS